MRSLALASVALATALASVAAAQPAAPSLLDPEDEGGRFIDGWHYWRPVEGASAYRLQVDTLGGEFDADLVIDDTVAAPGPDASKVEHFNSVPEGRYEWRVAALAGDEQGPWSEVWSFLSKFPVAAEGGPGAAATLAVYPNPAPSVVTVAFGLPVAGRVRVTVHDVRGREVAVLLDERAAAGERRVRWEPARAAAGPYLVRLAAGGAAVSRVLVLRP